MSAAIPLADGYGPAWASAWGVDDYGLYAEFTFRGVVQRMRWIAPGTFSMGSPEKEPGREDNEVQHEVRLIRGYWVADTACTQALWEVVMMTNPSHFQGRERPVERVSWQDCQGFLERLNGERPEFGARLLTEAEWENACRAGKSEPFSFGANITPEQVNFDGKHRYSKVAQGVNRGKTVAVKALPPTGGGLYEMPGTVWEWCADWYGDYARDAPDDPKGPPQGEMRVLRGGSWSVIARNARSARRNRSVPATRSSRIGFRFARGQE